MLFRSSAYLCHHLVSERRRIRQSHSLTNTVCSVPPPWLYSTMVDKIPWDTCVIDDIRIPRWPWDECALSHECEANAGKLAVKIQQMYGKLWLVWRKRKKILKTGRFQSLKHICRPEEDLSPTKKGRISRTDGKSSRTCPRIDGRQ